MKRMLSLIANKTSEMLTQLFLVRYEISEDPVHLLDTQTQIPK